MLRTILENILLFYQHFALAYFAALNLLYALNSYWGLRSILAASREGSLVGMADLLAGGLHQPVSVLVPAYNEEKSIVASVGSFLALNYPEFEVIVVSDGSKDATMDRLKQAFMLQESFEVRRKIVPTAEVRAVYTSPLYPNLTVVEKANGGKADALNAALNLARYPLVCSVDADSLLDGEALLRASRMFVEDDTVIGVGGTIRPLNGSRVAGGRVEELRLPSTWIELFQVVEYARAFLSGRSGWAHFDALLVISGAFGVFRREVVLAVGAYDVDTVGEDMEIVLRMHRYYCDRGLPYRIVFTPDPLCWTEVPSDFGSLRRQRNRWQRGLWETLWTHRAMMFNPRYGKIGLIALPYFMFFEGLAPVVEAMGCVFLPASLLLKMLFPEYAVLFLALAFLYGMLLSQLALGIESLMNVRYNRVTDRLILLVAAFFEQLGFRQLLAFERLVATLQVWKKRGTWGAMRRVGISSQ